jgi:UDP-N-acetylmuramate--alanine ligase
MELNKKINEPFSYSMGEQPKGAIYFIGIGGIGMSALARFFKSRGWQVSGYDKTPTELTAQLVREGIDIHFHENVDMIPKEVEMVVYTPAIPADHRELVYYRDHGYHLVKRSDVLQLITEKSVNICVAGTHGKTTITSMIAHILRHSGAGGNAFLGGISVNYETNFWSSPKNLVIVEADEYDRSFLKLSPDIAVITAMDADHLDIYGTAGEMENAFIAFSQRVKPGGLLVRNFGLKRGSELAGDPLTYSLQNESADAYAANIRMKEGSYFFDISIREEKLEDLELHMGGMHNVENAVASVAVARSLNIEGTRIREALAAYKGVKRRFEYLVKNQRMVMIDDYAHHPEELRALITGAKSLFRQRKCTVVFQPHLFTRTRDLAEGFAEALDLADQVVLLPIYPARELPLEGVSSEMILEKMKKENTVLVEKDALVQWARDMYMPSVNKEFGALFIMAGAGDIDQLTEPIKNILKEI